MCAGFSALISVAIPFAACHADTPTINVPAPTQGPTESNTPYLLSPGDAISVNVLGHPDFTVSATILSDGTFEYPSIGIVHAAGMTTIQLSRFLTKKLETSGLLEDPSITTVVTSVAATISVVGDVKSPGRFPLRPGMGVLDALADAGGLNQQPQIEQVTLVKSETHQNVAVDPIKLFGGDQTQNISIDSQDIVLVQPLDPNSAEVNVVGDVVKPGQYVIPENGTPVFSLISLAGGANTDAALSHVQIVHKGVVTVADLRTDMDNITASITGATAYPGDLVIVPVNNRKIAVLGEVKSPSVYVIPDGEQLSLAAAISVAGGLTDDADKEKVQIIRGADTPNPTVINVDLNKYLASGTASGTIQSKDVVYIPRRHKGGGTNQVFGVGALLGGAATFIRLFL